VKITIVGTALFINNPEWKEFRSLYFTELKNRMKSAIVFDGRNQYVNYQLDQLGFDYYQNGK
jgi:UDPglucose 6-dehydrogenase